MILIDHCVPRRYIKLLTEWGYHVETSTAHIGANAEDQKVIGLASQLDAILLTVDMDFASIIDYPPSNYEGIIVVRYSLETQVNLDVTLKQALDELYRNDLRRVLVIVTASRYRVRS
jgi:predicted nuclease of predicted toxin-antitoxin system